MWLHIRLTEELIKIPSLRLNPKPVKSESVGGGTLASVFFKLPSNSNV